jgi:N-acetylornithine carbamoyltransferase
MSRRDFLSLDEWSSEEIEDLLSLASRVKRGEITGGLERKLLALVIKDPSFPTSASFQAAMALHGGQALVLEPGMSPGEHESRAGAVLDANLAEPTIDLARVSGRYADCVGVRAVPPGREWAAVRQDSALKSFAARCEKPVINLESVRRHPCQALADAFTLRERLERVEGKRFVLTWAWHPRALPTSVPVSAALAAAQLGMEIVIARPEGYELDPEDTALMRRIAQRAGGEFVHISDDPDDALVGADAVYVQSWGSIKLYGQPEQEAERRAELRDWRLTSGRLRSTRGGKGIVMHALPVRRSVEIDDKVLEGPSSAVVDQAENRLHVQRALLLRLIGRS